MRYLGLVLGQLLSEELYDIKFADTYTSLQCEGLMRCLKKHLSRRLREASFDTDDARLSLVVAEVLSTFFKKYAGGGLNAFDAANPWAIDGLIMDFNFADHDARRATAVLQADSSTFLEKDLFSLEAKTISVKLSILLRLKTAMGLVFEPQLLADFESGQRAMDPESFFDDDITFEERVKPLDIFERVRSLRFYQRGLQAVESRRWADAVTSFSKGVVVLEGALLSSPMDLFFLGLMAELCAQLWYSKKTLSEELAHTSTTSEQLGTLAREKNLAAQFLDRAKTMFAELLPRGQNSQNIFLLRSHGRMLSRLSLLDEAEDSYLRVLETCQAKDFGLDERTLIDLETILVRKGDEMTARRLREQAASLVEFREASQTPEPPSPQEPLQSTLEDSLSVIPQQRSKVTAKLPLGGKKKFGLGDRKANSERKAEKKEASLGKNWGAKIINRLEKIGDYDMTQSLSAAPLRNSNESVSRPKTPPKTPPRSPRSRSAGEKGGEGGAHHRSESMMGSGRRTPRLNSNPSDSSQDLSHSAPSIRQREPVLRLNDHCEWFDGDEWIMGKVVGCSGPYRDVKILELGTVQQRVSLQELRPLTDQ